MRVGVSSPRPTDANHCVCGVSCQRAPITGSLMSGGDFGADGGFIKALVIDGTTYTFDPKGLSNQGSYATSGGADRGVFDTTTNSITVKTTLGGTLIVDMDNGQFTYTPPKDSGSNQVETIKFVASDNDGDLSSANLVINVNTNAAPVAGADHVITNIFAPSISVPAEACPLALAPTSSTTASLAMGDALAVALLDARGFTADDFARSHPAGSLGRRLLLHITDVMHTGEDLPKVDVGASLSEALMEMSRKRLGMTAVVDGDGRLAGLFTDGDLRRTLDDPAMDVRTARIADVMTRHPRTIGADQLAVEAARLMETHKISGLIVVDDELRPVGALNIHDLLRARVV